MESLFAGECVCALGAIWYYILVNAHDGAGGALGNCRTMIHNINISCRIIQFGVRLKRAPLRLISPAVSLSLFAREHICGSCMLVHIFERNRRWLCSNASSVATIISRLSIIMMNERANIRNDAGSEMCILYNTLNYSIITETTKPSISEICVHRT